VRTLKLGFSIVSALVPIIYCCGLLYYFFDVGGGSVEGVETIGLGPTMMELGMIGLLCCIPVTIKLVRIFAKPRSPGPSGPDTSARDDETGAEAEAAIARYKARQSTPAAPNAPIVSPARGSGGPASSGPAKRPGFGRRIG
jgi:hypothetical protein